VRTPRHNVGTNRTKRTGAASNGGRLTGQRRTRCSGSRLRPDVNRYLKWAFIEAANAICLMRRRHPHRHVSRLYERIARRKGHPKAIGAVARYLAEATFWLLSKQEAYREPQASAVSSTGDKRDFAMSSRKLEF
jgi:hypothetical protein